MFGEEPSPPPPPPPPSSPPPPPPPSMASQCLASVMTSTRSDWSQDFW